MEKDDYALASSVLEATRGATNTDGISTSRKVNTPRSTSAIGDKRSGMRAVAASLASDQLRFAGLSSSAGVSAAPPLHPALRGHGDGGSGSQRARFARAYASTARPDMFSHTSPTASAADEPFMRFLSGVSAADDEDRVTRAASDRTQAERAHPPLVLRRRTEPPCPATSSSTAGESTDPRAGTTAALAKLPEMNSWFRASRRLHALRVSAHAGVAPVDSVGVTCTAAKADMETGSHWLRHDDMTQDELSVRAAIHGSSSCASYSSEDKAPAETAQVDAEESLAALALSCTAGSAVVPFGRTVEALPSQSTLNAYFTFTRSEFEESMRASARSPSDSESSLTFEETCKLFRLYELFGSFPVVADRWHWYDRSATPVACATSPRTHPKRSRAQAFFAEPLTEASGNPASSPLLTAAPRVELLCAHYERVCTAVMQQRHTRLRRLLLGHSHICHGGEGDDNKADCDAASKSNGPVNADRKHVSSSTPALLQFFEKQPLWRPARESVCASHTPSSHSSVTSPSTDAPLDGDEGPTSQTLDALSARCATPLDVIRSLSTPAPWYAVKAERVRRDALRQLLHCEAAVNVPYQRAAVAYVDQLKRAAQQLERVRQQLVGLPLQDGVAREAAPVTLSVPLAAAQLQVQWRDLPPGVNPALLRSARHLVESSAGTLPAAHDTSARIGIGAHVHMSSSVGSGRVASIASVLEEAVHQVPWECARLVGVVRAGWMLPPPRPLNVPDAAGEEAVDSGVSHGATRRLERVHATGVVNRVASAVGESILLSYASTVPKLYREVEQELEKHLLEDHRALMVDSPVVVAASQEARCLYAQNVLLRRLVQKCESVLEGTERVQRGVTQQPTV